MIRSPASAEVPVRRISLCFATVEYTAEGCVTRFDDGASFGALPHDTHHYAVIAHRTGYGDDLLAYCREHEVCHLIAEEALRGRPSAILWGLAHGQPVAPLEAVYEELAAQALQRWLRANERPIIGGVDWDEIKRYALAKLDG
jgi:hypothetical protein